MNSLLLLLVRQWQNQLFILKPTQGFSFHNTSMWCTRTNNHLLSKSTINNVTKNNYNRVLRTSSSKQQRLISSQSIFTSCTRKKTQHHYSNYCPTRLLSTTKNAIIASKITFEERRQRFWNFFAKTMKYARIPALVLSVYSLGYTAGIADYSRNPNKFKELAYESVIKSVGVYDPNQIQIARQGEKVKVEKNDTSSGANNGYGKGSNRDIQLRNIAYVSEKILDSAKRLVLEELKKVSTVDKDGTIIPTNEGKYQKWFTALESLDTSGTNDCWKFILLDVDMVNAFVTETTPYTIYVTTGMLENIVSNDDELALILGHELSHLLFAHSTQAITLEKNLKAVEVLLLSLDPTEGLTSLVVMWCLAFIRKGWFASHSRENETEADELGIKLAAMSCYNTKRASKVFAKMHEYHINLETEDGIKISQFSSSKSKDKDANENKGNGRIEGYALQSFMDSHPPTLMRYETLLDLSKEENPDKYPSQCSNTRRKLLKALRLDS